MPVQRQSAITIDTPTSLESENNDNKVFSPVTQACDNALLHETVDTSNLALTEQNYGKNDQPNLVMENEKYVIEEDEESSNDDRDARDFNPPPLPITPPPPKSLLEHQDSILSLFDPLENQNIHEEPGTLSLDQNSYDYPIFNRSTSYTSDDEQIVLPSIPDSYMPRWSRQHSEPPSVDLDLLQFELMTDEQDHLPSSVLPETPQPESLATTITDYDASEPDTEYDYDEALNEQLEMLRDKSDDPKPPAPSHQSSNSTSKRNSWNTTSSFAYDNDNDDMDSFQKDDQNWAENTPSVIAVPVNNKRDNDDNNNNQDESDDFRKSPRRSRNSRVMSIAAMFEANTSPASSTNSTMERHKASEAQRSTESLAKKPLVRRPTAMEILATPTVNPSKNDEEEDDIDLRKLRRSIVRGARLAVGLNTDPEALMNDPKIKRSTSLSPMDFQQNKGTSDSMSDRPRPRPRSLILQQDIEASF